MMAPEVERPKEVQHDETPSGITDHPFVPKGEWWSLCGHVKPDGTLCNLARSAHAETTVQPPFWYVSDDMPEVFD